MGVEKMSETRHVEVDRERYCHYCRGRLYLGYHFTCHVCGDSYCYIHMARHARVHAAKTVPDEIIFAR